MEQHVPPASLKDNPEVDRMMRHRAIEILRQLGEDAPIEPLVRALDHPNEWVRRDALSALAATGPRAPLDALLKGLYDPSSTVRDIAMSTLGSDRERIPLDALIALLRTSRFDDSHSAALRQLARIDPPAALAEFAAILHDESGSLWKRVSAARALGSLGIDAAIPPLVAALDSPEWDVRASAATALGQLSERLPDVPDAPLIAVVRNAETETAGRQVREAACQALTKIWKHADVEYLLSYASAPLQCLDLNLPFTGEMRAIETLRVAAIGALGPRTPLDVLEGAASEYLIGVRQAVVHALAQMGADAPVALLTQAIHRDADPFYGPVATAALQALAALPDRAPVALLVEVLNAPDHAGLDTAARVAAARALAAMPERAPSGPLLEVLRHETTSAEVYKAAGKALLAKGANAPIEQIMALLGVRNTSVRLGAMTILAQLGERAPVESLIQALAVKDAEVRVAAIQALAQLGERVPVEPFVRALADRDKDVRRAVLEAVQEYEDLAARMPPAALAAALRDADGDVRYNAALALAHLGAGVPVEPLLDALRDVHDWVRGAAAQALTAPDVPAPEGPLLAALGDTDRTVHTTVVFWLQRERPPIFHELVREAEAILDGHEPGPLLETLWQGYIAVHATDITPLAPEVVDYLSGLLDAPFWQTRAKAASALAKIDGALPIAAVPRLEQLRDDEESEAVRLAAADALTEHLLRGSDEMDDSLGG